MPESLLEPGGDTFSETGPFPAHPEHKRVDLRDGLRRVALFVDSDFDGPDQTFPVQEVGGVVEAGGGPPQSFGEGLHAAGGQFGAQGRVCRYFDEAVPLEHRLQVHAGAAYEDRQAPAAPDRGERLEEAALEQEDVELGPRLDDVDQVMGDLAVLGQVLACADVHPPVDLAGVGGDDLAGQAAGQSHPEPGLSGGGRSEYHQEVEVRVSSWAGTVHR